MGFKKKRLISVLIQLALAMGSALSMASSRGFAWSGDAYMNCRHLSDGFFVSSVIFIGMGSLLWISNTGFFDIFSYGVKSLLVLFTPMKKAKEFPHYYEYKCERDARREGRPITHTVLIVGLISLALSLLFLALYYRLTPAL